MDAIREIFDDIEIWMTTQLPAIQADPQTFIDYMRDQEAYYRSLDSEYSVQFAELIAGAIELRIALQRRATDNATF